MTKKNKFDPEFNFNSEFNYLNKLGFNKNPINHPMSKMKIAIRNDEQIFFLAMYYQTRGMTKKNIDYDQIMNRFSEFKIRIKKGCFTLKQLQNDVFERYGLVE